jgi:hypothetical protein
LNLSHKNDDDDDDADGKEKTEENGKNTEGARAKKGTTRGVT